MVDLSSLDNMYKHDREPDFINDEGNKWWLQKITWGSSRNLAERLKALNITWWYVELADGSKEHVVLKEQQIIKTDKNLESLGVFLDMCPIAYEE